MADVYDYGAGFTERAAVSLANPRLRRAVADSSDRVVAARLRAFESLDDPDALRDTAARLRDAVLSRLDVHLDALATNWEAHGGRVFFAADAAEARDYVRTVTSGAGIAVKSKSMASEEIGLNGVLESAGMEVVETDLGEWILQLAGEHPSHIVAPAIHKSKADVAELFSEMAGTRLPVDTAALTAFARDQLRAKFLAADVGITGTNFGVSEAGAVCIVTNEGNARMCSSLPRVHIALMGMERVVGTFDELAVMLALLGRSATGQKLSQYTTLLFGPRRPNESDGPEESHLVVLDNGRSKVLGTPFQAALRCIRCGACLNVCPVYRQVGGHAYDTVYSGPIGAVLNPLLRDSPQARELAHASTLCGACTEVCPVRIPLHDLLLKLRRGYAEKDAGRVEKAAYSLWARAWGTPRGFRATAVLGRLGMRLPARSLPLLNRWTRGRTPPTTGPHR
jgi:L-lactate dehydrogenase complex protein LldF